MRWVLWFEATIVYDSWPSSSLLMDSTASRRFPPSRSLPPAPRSSQIYCLWQHRLVVQQLIRVLPQVRSRWIRWLPHWYTILKYHDCARLGDHLLLCTNSLPERVLGEEGTILEVERRWLDENRKSLDSLLRVMCYILLNVSNVPKTCALYHCMKPNGLSHIYQES